MPEPTYTHVYDFLIEINKSTNPDGADITPQQFREALKARLIRMQDEELLEAFGDPLETYTELE